jgi:GntR family transcriptional regulator/MocR family aminotransferase
VRDLIFPVQHNSGVGLQTQLRQHLVDAILDGRLSGEEPLPSCRRLAQALGVSRNTVVLAYQALADEGLLISRERVGYFVNSEMVFEQSDAPANDATAPAAARSRVDWWHRLSVRPSEQLQLAKPGNWKRYPYPFIYGQTDPKLFPVSAWRMCSRQALGIDAIQHWSEDSFNDDDPRLIEEVRARVLPRRGVKASPNEILITMGAQNAIYLIAQLLSRSGRTIGFEDPGYVDARNIFALTGASLKPLPIDSEGIIVDRSLDACDCVYVTPSHQSPTTVTLPLARRVALLDKAESADFIVVEDDYEAETNFVSAPTTALKSMDRSHRVVYVGSFSKYLAPGLRIGYMVGSEEFIHEARLLRRLILRHPPANNQRTVALFIAGGYYDALVHRLQRGYRARWEAMGEALSDFMPACRISQSSGGTSFWIRGPEGLDSDVLASKALGQGIVIEPGSIYFLRDGAPRNYLRLGFSSIELDKIRPGIQRLADLIDQQL